MELNLNAVAEQTFEIPRSTRDRSAEFIDDDGRPLLLSGVAWATTNRYERGLMGYRHGIYSFPTTQLADRLKDVIAGRTAIEIGAGHGVLAEALGIKATDSREQEKPKIRAALLSADQPPVRYGPNVVKSEASRAVRLYRPQVVIGCWVTETFDRARQGGKKGGVDELAILDQVETYVLVGNELVHQRKRIWDRPHTIEYPWWVVSRAVNGSRDFIAVWNRG